MNKWLSRILAIFLIGGMLFAFPSIIKAAELPQDSLTENGTPTILIPEKEQPSPDGERFRNTFAAESSTLFFNVTNGMYTGAINITGSGGAVLGSPSVPQFNPLNFIPSEDSRLGGGSYSYNSDTKTLTITNLTWITSAAVGLYIPADIKLEIVGANTITSDATITTQTNSAAIYCGGILTISGTGSLTATGAKNTMTSNVQVRSHGIIGRGSTAATPGSRSIIINSGTIIARGGDITSNQGRSIGIWGFDQITEILGGNIKAYGGAVNTSLSGESTGLSSDAGVIVNGGILYAEGVKFGMYSNLGVVTIKGGETTAVGASIAVSGTGTGNVVVDHTGPYRWWTNTTTEPATGAGTDGSVTPYSYSNTQKYLRIVVTSSGAAVSTPATFENSTTTSISINAAVLDGTTNQTIEYAYNQDGTTIPSSIWQDGLTFTGLNPNTSYYILARAKMNDSYDTGIAAVSSAMQTQPLRYDLSIIDGTDDTGAGSYAAGTVIAITAKAPPTGMIFEKWTSDNGGKFADQSAPSTSFTMPAGAVTITANYKNDSGGTAYSFYFINNIDSYTKGDNVTLTLFIDRELSFFKKALVDGVDLGAADHSVKSGSTVITLNSSFLGTLSPGKHILRVEFADGDYIEASFTTLSPTPPAPTTPATPPSNIPGTGDDGASIVVYEALAVAMIGAVVILNKKRKNTS